MAYDVQIKGQEAVLRHLKKLANPLVTFNQAVYETAARSKAELAAATLSKKGGSSSFSYGGETVISNNLKTGDTSRAWSNPFKVSNGYMVSNNKKTADGEYLIAELLEKGHKEIVPKNAKMLFIPLNRKGQKQGPGLVFGKDYILLKKVKALKGREYMKDIVNKASRYLTREILKDIRKVFV